MSKVAKRLLTFFIGLPLVIAIVFCDYLYHLPLQIIVGIFAVLGANEFYKMASTKTELFARELVLIGTALLPFACYTFILSGLSLDISPWLFWFLCSICLCLKLSDENFGPLESQCDPHS